MVAVRHGDYGEDARGMERPELTVRRMSLFRDTGYVHWAFKNSCCATRQELYATAGSRLIFADTALRGLLIENVRADGP
jgi:hypothetical protein